MSFTEQLKARKKSIITIVPAATSGVLLDSNTSKEVRKLFVRLNELGNAIMITHDLQVAKNTRRIVRIDGGQLFAGDEHPLSA